MAAQSFAVSRDGACGGGTEATSPSAGLRAELHPACRAWAGRRRERASDTTGIRNALRPAGVV